MKSKNIDPLAPPYSRSLRNHLLMILLWSAKLGMAIVTSIAICCFGGLAKRQAYRLEKKVEGVVRGIKAKITMFEDRKDKKIFLARFSKP